MNLEHVRKDGQAVRVDSPDAVVARALQMLEDESRPWLESLRRAPRLAPDEIRQPRTRP